MTGLVSFTLFGDDPNDVYYEGAFQNARQYHTIFPDFDLWFYVGKSVPDSVIRKIKVINPRAEFDLIDEPEDQTATWWRYRALRHSNHDFILFRDVDSRLNDREISATREWLDSDFEYHVMRDHQYHGRQLLAGLWSIKRGAFGNHRNIPESITGDWYGTDQVALLTWVWPACRRRILAHIGCYHIFEKMDQRMPFSVPRSKEVPFVAQGFNGDGTLRYPEHFDKVDDDRDLLAREDIFLEKYRKGRDVSRTVQT